MFVPAQYRSLRNDLNENRKVKVMREKWKLTPFGIKVKKSLLEKNMTVSELAERIGVKQSYLSQVLYGDKKGYKYLDEICTLLEIEKE